MKIKVLEWDYCKCGCKCNVAKNTNFHIFDNLKGKYTLFEGRDRLNSQDFRSSRAAEREAQRRHEAALKVHLV